MHASNLSVTLSLSHANHFDGLAEALARRGMLHRALRFGHELEVLEPDAAGELKRVTSLPLFRIANRLQERCKGIPLVRRWQKLPFFPAMIADRWMVQQLKTAWLPPSDVFHALRSISVRSLYEAKKQGSVPVLDEPSLHPKAFQREVLAECAAAGIPPQASNRLQTSSHMCRFEEQFAICDRIVVLSSAALRSFWEFPYADKVRVVLPGTNHHLFTPAANTNTRARQNGVFRVCYAGRVESAKGVTYLLHAWKRLALPNAELVLIGRVYPEIGDLMTQDASIRCLGHVSREQMAQGLRECDLFVFPSMNEGFPLVVLEAMASGLPVIACQDTGSADCIVHGENGFLVPGRNSEALAEQVLWCHQNREQIRAMGQAARQTIESNFTLAHYEERMVNLYGSLTGARHLATGQ